jgi:hypothetical protein
LKLCEFKYWGVKKADIHICNNFKLQKIMNTSSLSAKDWKHFGDKKKLAFKT